MVLSAGISGVHFEGGSVKFQCDDAGEIGRGIVGDKTVNHLQDLFQTVLFLCFFFLISLLHETHFPLLDLLHSFFLTRWQFLLHYPIDL